MTPAIVYTAAARRRPRHPRSRLRARRLPGARGRSPSRPSPTRTSRPSPSPTRRSPARWTSPSRTARAEARRATSSSPTTPTRTAARSPSRDPVADGWRMLRGDEVGALLAAHLVAARGRAPGTFADHDRLLVAARPGSRRPPGSPYVETLTGFKWIGPRRRAALRLRGGARLLRRPGGRPRQGRHHRRPARSPSSPPSSRRPAARSPTCWTTSRWSTGCTPPTSSRSASRTCR